ALVAIEHTLLTAIWHMITADVGYTDLGGDYYTRRNPDKTKQRALAQLRQLGYTVTLDPLPAAG
ncbi:MAG TPA: IS110 family transposase, partial [Dermatophilaceae bacterium]|nr:IS110 family transposase [Dermatophilaceae bacterium]